MKNSDYDMPDLTTLPDDYLPRTSAIIPRQVVAATCVTTAFRDSGQMLDFAALPMCIVADFLTRTAGANHVRLSQLRRLPILTKDSDPRLRTAP